MPTIERIPDVESRAKKVEVIATTLTQIERETTPEAEAIFGGHVGALAILNSLDTAATALGQGRVEDFKQEVVTVREKIKETRPDLDPILRAEFHKQLQAAFVFSTVRNADWNQGNPGHIPPPKTTEQLAREKELREQAEEADNLMHGVVRAVHEMERQTQFKPDEIILTPKHFIKMSRASYNSNPYSCWFPSTMNFSEEPMLFGIKVKAGLKSCVSLKPVVEFIAVPGVGLNGLTEVIARPVELRREITVPIVCEGSFVFRGYIICRKTRGELIQNVSENEMTAIESLREMISETEFRRYIKYGFILVRGKSGSTYQVFRNHSHTKVWKGGKLIEEVCVRIRAQVPPTDNVIAFKTMIEIDEEEFKKSGNRYRMMA